MITTEAPSLPIRSRKRTPTWAVIGVLSLCGTVVALQQTMVVPLLPDFPGILGVSSDDASWLVTATLLTSAVATPIMSRLADMFGKRLMMIVCMVAMTLGSVVAAAGGAYLTLIVGRSLQGFAAALIPIGISIMRDELPREKVGSAVALMSATLGIGSAMGLPLSGIIYENLGWEAIFWISAGAGVALIGGGVAPGAGTTGPPPGPFFFPRAGALAAPGAVLFPSVGCCCPWGGPRCSWQFPGVAVGGGAANGFSCCWWSRRGRCSSGFPTNSRSATPWSTCGPPPAGPCCSPTSRPCW